MVAKVMLWLKNRQSMTACSLLQLLLLRIPHVTTLGPKMWLSNISVKYSEEKSVSEEVSKIGECRIEIGRVRCGLGFHCYTHSEGQHSNLRRRDSKLQKTANHFRSVYRGKNAVRKFKENMLAEVNRWQTMNKKHFNKLNQWERQKMTNKIS